LPNRSEKKPFARKLRNKKRQSAPLLHRLIRDQLLGDPKKIKKLLLRLKLRPNNYQLLTHTLIRKYRIFKRKAKSNLGILL
jgi:hypothetical protein